jgi:hypothetical protein
MNAGHLDARPFHEVTEGKVKRATDKAIDREGPRVAIKARNAEMAEHNRILDGRQVVLKLVRLKRMPKDRLRRIKPNAIHAGFFHS